MEEWAQDIVTVHMEAVVQARADLATIKTLCLKLEKYSGFRTGKCLVGNKGLLGKNGSSV